MILQTRSGVALGQTYIMAARHDRASIIREEHDGNINAEQLPERR